MAQKILDEDGVSRFLLKAGELDARKERKEGRWRIARYLGKKMLYIGCPYCNEINELRTGGVCSNGNLRGAVVCHSCGDGFRLKLENWDEYLEYCRENGESP